MQEHQNVMTVREEHTPCMVQTHAPTVRPVRTVLQKEQVLSAHVFPAQQAWSVTSLEQESIRPAYSLRIAEQGRTTQMGFVPAVRQARTALRRMRVV